MFRQQAKFQQIVKFATIQQQVKSSTRVASKVESSPSKTSEWEKARPYNQIPKVGLVSFMCYMLPGGRYANMEYPDMMLDLHRRLGPLYRLPGVMGKAEFLVCNDPEHFQRVIRVEGTMPERQGKSVFDYHRNQHRKDFYQGVEGLVSTSGDVWYKFRSAVNPVVMQPKTVRLYYQQISNIQQEFVQRIRDIRDLNTFEVPDSFEEEINRLTLESVSVIALDKQLGLLNENRNNPEATKLLKNLTELFVVLSELDMKPSFWRYIHTPLFKKALRVLDNIQELTVGFVNEAIERKDREKLSKQNADGKSMLDQQLKIDKKIATIMAMDMLLVGVDTTASMFASCLLCLAQNPDKQAKLREEVLHILPHRDSEFTEDSMKNIPYLRACIKESLRIYPLLSANSRIVKSDIVLDDYQIPKETAVIMLNHGLLTNEQHYPRSKEFLPERWLRRSKEESSQCPHSLKASNPFVYLPFGYGPRMCIGKRIVEMELELGIARLIRNFHIEFNHPSEKAFKSLFINVPNIPLKFTFKDVKNC